MPKEDPFVNRAQLLKAIKKYPEIWDSNNKLHMCRSVTAPLWNEIAEQFGGHVPTVKLQSIWSQMKYHYHNLVHRQILHKERFTTKWEHFEPMSFMYNITVAKIVGTASTNVTVQSTAPISVSSSTATSSTEALTTTQPPPAQPQPQLPTPSASQLTPAGSITSTPHSGRGRPSGTFTSWLPPSNQQQQQHQQHHQNSNHPHQEHVQQNQMEVGSIHQTRSPLMHTGLGPESGVESSSQYTDFSGLIPPSPPVVALETTVTTLRKSGRPGSLNNSMRGRIIDAIKARPVLWAGRQREPQQRSSGPNSNQNRTSAVWKEIATELGLTPSLVQTRWSIIKQRYVDELQKERHSHYSQQGFRSTWEHFDRMSFMRDILSKKVDEREQTREHIQEIVNEQQQQQSHLIQQQQQQKQHQQPHPHPHPQQQSQQQANLLRYNGRPPQLQHPAMMMTAGLTGLPCVTSNGLVAAAAAAAAAGASVGVGAGCHPLICSSGDINGASVAVGVPSIGGAGVDVSSMLPMHLSSVIGRRRVKTESDLEWDPFEMILQVHGTEPAAN